MAQQHYRLRLRGKQRDDIDVDLLAEALLMVMQEMQEPDGTAEDDELTDKDCE